MEADRKIKCIEQAIATALSLLVRQSPWCPWERLHSRSSHDNETGHPDAAPALTPASMGDKDSSWEKEANILCMWADEVLKLDVKRLHLGLQVVDENMSD